MHVKDSVMDRSRTMRMKRSGWAEAYDKHRHLILPLLSIAIILLLWELTVRYSGWSNQVFPSPSKVMQGMGELINNGALLQHSVASLLRITVGFYLAVVLAIPLGILIGRVETIRMMLNPVIQFLRPISPLAWIPLAMLWFGIGDKPAIFLIFLAIFLPLVVATAIAASKVNSVYFQVAANFRFSRWETVTKIIAPAIMPDILTALRLTVGIGWLVVVAAEMIAVRSGLGYLILDSRNALRMDYVMVGMIMIGLIGVALDMLMARLILLLPGYRAY
jgi:NitT/TauT family transport system permease protein